nr:TPA_inf: conotoxin precursor O1 [Conus judaeus]
MKMTYILIVAVLFLTAWTSVTAGDFKNGPKNRQIWEKVLSKARDEMKNPEASKLDKRCRAFGKLCGIGSLGLKCCNGPCQIVCMNWK